MHPLTEALNFTNSLRNKNKLILRLARFSQRHWVIPGSQFYEATYKSIFRAINMKTLTLQEAAALLKMTSEGLRLKAIKGEIPGAKPGKRWVFSEDDLAEYLRSLYSSNAKT